MKKLKLDEYIGFYTIDPPLITEFKDFGNAIVRCHKDYKNFYKGDDISEYDKNSFQKKMHTFDVGDLIGIVVNYDWDKNLALFTGEFEFKKESIVLYNDSDSSNIYFVLEDEKVIILHGEYFCVNNETLIKINKNFNSNYTVVFFSY